MHAAVVRDPAHAPAFEEFPDPVPQHDEVIVNVLAAGLHPLVRILANGTHYAAAKQYPMVPGVDGVCELPDGRPAYFGFLRAPHGTMAERAAANVTKCLVLPDGVSPAEAAGGVNPGMSSVAALAVRGQLVRGESVLVLGATGAAGKLSVQVARALGAARIVAVGRNASALGALGADAVIPIDDGFADAVTAEFTAHRPDVVLDYLWGPPAEAVLGALAAKQVGIGAHRVRYVQVGDMAGKTIGLSAGTFRSTAIELCGSGIGSVSPAQLAECVAKVLDFAAAKTLRFDVRVEPLSRVTEVWAAPSDARVVFAP